MKSFNSLLPKPKHSPETTGNSLTSVQANSSLLNGPVVPISNKNSKNTLTVKYTKDGQIDYSVIATQGHSESRKVQSSFSDTIPMNEKVALKNVRFPKPTDEEVKECVENTRIALQKIIDSKVLASKTGPTSSNAVENRNEPTYVKYTSSSLVNNRKPKERIIKIIDTQEDPMLPPKFKLRKNRARTPSPPPPVLRSPPREISKEEQDKWSIPAAISNWKNPQGFTVSIEKRLAANQTAQQMDINENFGTLSEALEAAEKQAREEIGLRAKLSQQLAENVKREKEETLKKLAEQARIERMNQSEGNSRKRRYS